MKELDAKFRNIATQYKSPAGAAKAVYKVLVEYAQSCGMDPNMEVSIRTPEENLSFGFHKCWYVGFEAGDYQWAIASSFTLASDHWYTEPYYSFDLNFVTPWLLTT